jgi:hypothetical protein
MYEPKWDGPIAGYATSYMKRHYWRLQHSMDWEDVMQECRCLFYKLDRTYGDEVDTGAWFMGLYKTSLTRLVNDLSKEDTYLRHCIRETELSDDDSEWMSSRISTEDNEGTLNCLITDAPDEVRAVISLFLQAPPQVYEQASLAWQMTGRKKEHGNAFLCSMLGFDERVNVVRMIRQHFIGGNA